MAGACGYGSETGGVMADIRTLTVEKIRAYHKVRASCIGALYPSGVEERGEGGGAGGLRQGHLPVGDFQVTDIRVACGRLSESCMRLPGVRVLGR